jgi:glycine cleavage system regulatory protein
MERKILTLLGPDRPGLVRLLADAVRQGGGNWRTSRLARLAGQFAGVVEFDLPGSGHAALDAAVANLRGDGYAVNLLGGAVAESAAGGRWQIDLQGNDRPGIVQEVSRAVAEAGGNVEEWESRVVSAPMSGGALFELLGTVRLPPGADPETLRLALEALGGDLAVSISLRQAQNP